MALSRREASLRPAHPWCSRGHFGTVSVRSKLSPLCVPVNPSPVWREASRDLWLSIGPSTMIVFNCECRYHLIHCAENIVDDFLFMFTSKRTLYLRQFKLDETAVPDVCDQRGRRKTAELDTSGAKRAATWQGRVKW